MIMEVYGEEMKIHSLLCLSIDINPFMHSGHHSGQL